MFGIHDFWVFVVAGVILNLTPGPDSFYIFGRSLAQGRGAGVASALGISAGSIVHTCAAAVGVSALIAASATAFLTLKFAGAAYLIYLGTRMLVSRVDVTEVPAHFSASGGAAAFRQGLITNVLNPKVALFYLAFLPQFISADSTAKFAAFVTLGLCFVCTGTMWGLCLAWGASLIGDQFRRKAWLGQAINRTAGALFIALGVRVATAD